MARGNQAITATLRKCQLTLLCLIALTAYPLNWFVNHQHHERETVVLIAVAILLFDWIIAGFTSIAISKVLNTIYPDRKQRYWLWFVFTEMLCLAGLSFHNIYGAAIPFLIIFFGGGAAMIVAQRRVVE